MRGQQVTILALKLSPLNIFCPEKLSIKIINIFSRKEKMMRLKHIIFFNRRGEEEKESPPMGQDGMLLPSSLGFAS